MTAVGLADRVVEVIADLGAQTLGRYRYGSGCIVAGRTVLTAAHVVAGAVAVTVRDTKKRSYRATLDERFVGDVDGPGPDLALVAIEDPSFTAGLPAMELAVVERSRPTADSVPGCHAVGFPWFAEIAGPDSVRDSVDACGEIPVLSQMARGLLSVVVSIAPRPLPAEEHGLVGSAWSGMSGAPVVAGGRLLGVVSEHAPREGAQALTAVPLSSLEADPDHPRWGPGVADPAAWWARLGRTGELRRVPTSDARRLPAYWETVRELGRALHGTMPVLVGRERELAELSAFATGTGGYCWLTGGAYAGKTALTYELVTAGLPDDVDVVCYFMSRRASDADSNRFLAVVVSQLAALCDLDAPIADRDQLRALWKEAADRAAARARHLLLVVDGLDEDLRPSGSPSVAEVLPNAVGGRAHVLVTSRPFPDVPVEVPSTHPIRAAQETPVTLEPFAGSGELVELGRSEVRRLARERAGVAADVLGVMAAAAGPLAVEDLAELVSAGERPAPVRVRQVRRMVEEDAARSVEPVGVGRHCRYRFAHDLLLAQARDDADLGNPVYRDWLHQWAESWADRGWETADGTPAPRYLFDSYPAVLGGDEQRLTKLVTDVRWVAGAVAVAGVDQVLAILRTASGDEAPGGAVSAVFGLVRLKVFNLRPPFPVDRPRYTLGQLYLAALERGRLDVAYETGRSLRSAGVRDRHPVPLWTSYRADPSAVELGRHGSSIYALVVTDDGRVVSGGSDGKVLVWDPDAPPGAPPVDLGGRLYVSALVSMKSPWEEDPGEAPVWVAAASHGIELFDLADPGLNPDALGVGRSGTSLDGEINALAYLAASESIVSGDSEGRIMRWSLEFSAAPVELGRHDAAVEALVTLDADRVVSGGRDGQILLWDNDRPSSAVVLAGADANAPVDALGVLADGRVVSLGRLGMTVWDPARPGTPGQRISDITGTSLAILPDDRIVVADWRRVLLWDPAAPESETVLGEHPDVRVVAALPDGRVVSGGSDAWIRLWDTSTPLEADPRDEGFRQSTSIGPAMAALPDGEVIYDSRGQATAWHPRSPSDEWEFTDLSGQFLCAVATVDGRAVIVTDEGQVATWDPVSFELSRLGSYGPSWSETEENLDYCAFAVLDERRLVRSGTDGRLLLWDLAAPDTPTEIGSCSGEEEWEDNGFAVAALDDSRVISAADESRVLLWDVSRPGAPIFEFPDRADPNAFAVLPDGRVASSAGELLQLWDPAARTATELGRHGSPVYTVGVLGDGRVVSCGTDGRVLLWDPSRPGAPVDQLPMDVEAMAAATIHGTSTQLLAFAAGNQGGFSIWTIESSTATPSTPTWDLPPVITRRSPSDS